MRQVCPRIAARAPRLPICDIVEAVNPQAAVAIAQGHGRVQSFLQQIRPGEGRPMPVVAGVQREGNTPMSALPRIAGASPMMPQTQVPTMPEAQASGVTLMGLRETTNTWPMWLKIIIPVVVLGGLGAVAWGVSRHYKRKHIAWPDID